MIPKPEDRVYERPRGCTDDVFYDWVRSLPRVSLGDMLGRPLSPKPIDGDDPLWVMVDGETYTLEYDEEWGWLKNAF